MLKKFIALTVILTMYLLLPDLAEAQSGCEQLRSAIASGEATGVNPSALALAREQYRQACTNPTRSAPRSSEDSSIFWGATKPIDETYVATYGNLCDNKSNLDACCGMGTAGINQEYMIATEAKMIAGLERIPPADRAGRWDRLMWNSRNRKAYYERERQRLCSQPKIQTESSVPSVTAQSQVTTTTKSQAKVEPANECLRLYDFKLLVGENKGNGGYNAQNTCAFPVATSTCILQRQDGPYAANSMWYCQQPRIMKGGTIDYNGLGIAKLEQNRITYRSATCKAEADQNSVASIACLHSIGSFVIEMRSKQE